MKGLSTWNITVPAVATCGALIVSYLVWRKKRRNHNRPVVSMYEQHIGNTPCIYLHRLSAILKRHCWVKLESYNPGGTGKDRAALRIIESAEAAGVLPSPTGKHGIILSSKELQKGAKSDELELIDRAMKLSKTGGLVVEGTSGSTGIALATISALRGHACLVVMPDDQAKEKQELLRTLGAVVQIVPVSSISHPNHYVNTAKRMAHFARTQMGISALFCDQFETECNSAVHYETTGPEIWRQCRPDAFVMSAGTGGTIAGVGRYLKERDSSTRIVLVDPIGSVLANKVTHGIAFTAEQQERSLKRHRYDSLAEGIGLDRVTANFDAALPFIDEAYTVTDQDALDMARWILRHEGLLIGSSTAMNLVGTVRFARRRLSEGATICTIVCDSGQRHLTRFWNKEFVESRSLHWPSEDVIPIDLQDFMNDDEETSG